MSTTYTVENAETREQIEVSRKVFAAIVSIRVTKDKKIQELEKQLADCEFTLKLSDEHLDKERKQLAESVPKIEIERLRTIIADKNERIEELENEADLISGQ